MIGSLDPSSREATVIGAGAFGLIAAYLLDRDGYRVTLIDSAPRTGGLVRTIHTPHGLAECAAHSLLVSPPVARLFNELRVPLTPVRPGSESKYVLRNGKLRRFPLTAVEIASMLARAVTRIGTRAPLENPNLREWALHYLGAPALEYLISPMVTGIYGALPEELSVRAAMPRLAQMSRLTPDPETGLGAGRPSRAERRALRKNRPQMMAPLHGMGSFIEAITEHLRARLKERFRLNDEARDLSDFDSVKNVILAVPSDAAAALFARAATSRPELSRLADALAKVEYAPLASVTAFVPKTALKQLPQGVGVLFPASESRRSLGILFNSSAFEGRVRLPDSMVSLTFMLGGARTPEALGWSESEIRGALLADLDAVFGLRENATITHLEISRWPRAIPKYGPTLQNAWETARATWCARPGRILDGNYTGQVSIAKRCSAPFG